MIGKIGNVKSIPKPNSTVVQTALNLMAAYGGGDRGLRKDLQEMKKVQENNEDVLDVAKKAIVDSEKAEEAAIKEQAKSTKMWDKANSDLAKREAKLVSSRESLVIDKDNWSRDRKETNDHFAEYEDELAERDEVLLKAQKDVSALAAETKKAMDGLADRESKVSKGEADLAEREAGLRKYLS